jgi:hypothetical protein
MHSSHPNRVHRHTIAFVAHLFSVNYSDNYNFIFHSNPKRPSGKKTLKRPSQLNKYGNNVIYLKKYLNVSLTDKRYLTLDLAGVFGRWSWTTANGKKSDSLMESYVCFSNTHFPLEPYQRTHSFSVRLNLLVFGVVFPKRTNIHSYNCTTLYIRMNNCVLKWHNVPIILQ